jgi:hypothetical protein
MAYNTYDVDLTGSTFANLLTQTDFIIADNAGLFKFAASNQDAIKSGGLKDMRVYRQTFLHKFVDKKPALDRAGFFAVVMATAVVQTKSRVMRVVKGYKSPTISTAAIKVLGDFRDKRSMTNDIDTFVVVNLRTAFPEIIIITRMLIDSYRANESFTDSSNNVVNVQGWFRSPCSGQLAIDDATQATHMSYMEFFWKKEVTGSSATWTADDESWYGRTTKTDLVLLPEVAGVKCPMSGADSAGVANSRYTMADLNKFAVDIAAVINAEAPQAAGMPFHIP